MAQQIIPDSYFEELLTLNHTSLTSCSFCDYDTQTENLLLKFWGANLTISPGEKRVVDSTEPPLHEFLYLFLVYLLLNPWRESPAGVWISEKDFPGGPTFFRGPHLLPTHFISERFADDLESFSEKCRRLGGHELGLADASWAFTLLPGIEIAILYWQGDEDFPAEAKILFDRSLEKTMPLDMIFALAWGVCDRFRVG